MNFNEYRSNPLNRIIGLSVILAFGFLLVVLACIQGNWFPIIDGLIFASAHLPAGITKALAASVDYDFTFDPASGNSANFAVEAGQFISAFLVITGLYLPILLYHLHILSHIAMYLTILGGMLIYGTIYTFSSYFDPQEEEDDVGNMANI
ncbi:uncharacterized protein KQ657_001779 [Scheffersomyces spartinae]|uniref:Vacuolar protein sorting-associated protein 55 n=1 Tax=Scheffersomyces spartinae TaxID=45513 RepID=A0A9P7V6Q2_9ASCO|nr:uncharacterized protein KQ657_001779 [Scheffersomyces spartinae]KAG7192380.1 hypothetical protein KQ657_001779 [Scheffersomyces spartinae]